MFTCCKDILTNIKKITKMQTFQMSHSSHFNNKHKKTEKQIDKKNGK